MTGLTPEEISWRKELEEAGENAVRDSYNHGGGITMGSEPKLKFVRQWLRGKEVAHQKRENDIFCYTQKRPSMPRLPLYS